MRILLATVSLLAATSASAGEAFSQASWDTKVDGRLDLCLSSAGRALGCLRVEDVQTSGDITRLDWDLARLGSLDLVVPSATGQRADLLLSFEKGALVAQAIDFPARDIMGLLASVATDIDLAPGGWIGDRYDGATEQSDVTPTQYHKFLGQLSEGLVIDINTGAEVWNQGVDRFATSCTQNQGSCAAGETSYTCHSSFSWAADSFQNPDSNYSICKKGDTIVSGCSRYQRAGVSYLLCHRLRAD